MAEERRFEVELEPLEERSTAAVGISAVLAALVGRM
jgi:hypothetical protein